LEIEIIVHVWVIGQCLPILGSVCHVYALVFAAKIVSVGVAIEDVVGLALAETALASCIGGAVGIDGAALHDSACDG